jgi:hypothetical protein
MTIATASGLDNAPARLLLMPLISAVACVALAGWLRALSLLTWHPERYFANTPAERLTYSRNGKGW